MFGEDHATLGDVAFGADERVVLAASEARIVVRYHARQDQLRATRCTTHRSHSDHLLPVRPQGAYSACPKEGEGPVRTQQLRSARRAKKSLPPICNSRKSSEPGFKKAE
jgi:hypothetical protein